ncbi:M16 family metallopeptidase [Agrilutibacter solisilvae]|uniref:Insulinase family protein n=1 Tax=Agrilutibacter solisilvae TaxID=2763317 RepID=A0A975AS16_9GAMM|nr:pitrilysin family protein [Lysobacter solisilvae]QSX77783.1 insulinase family protein [Lysobacter solisilvae]
MTRVATLTLSILLCLPLLASAHPAPAAGGDATGTASSAQIASLAYTTRTLANGLKVYAIRDTTTANVSVQVWYDVGSKDDPKDRSGFAHLFEHLLFKATRNMVSEQFDRMTEDVGGFNNASTWDDFTNYYEVVPANHLQRLLWAESERMGSLVVDEKVFKSERDVVKEELRQRILARPYGKLFGLYLSETAFDVHPYARPGIGSIEELDAATVDDVRAFHATYYRPDNAILVVAGNFDPDQLDTWVDQYFAPVKRPAGAIPRVTAVEPARSAPRDYLVYEPNTPLPAVALTFQGPAAGSADQPAMLVLDAIMAKGDSSRLYQSLVYQQQLASQVMTNFTPSKDPGAFSLAAIMAEGKSADAGLAALRAQVARLREAPVTAAELDEAKNELVSDALRERETADGKGFALAFAAIVYGTPDRANTLLGDIQNVTAADVQRVARQYLAENQSVAIRYLDESAKASGAAATPIRIADTVQTRGLSVPASQIHIVTLAPEGERVQAPAPAAPVAATLPSFSEKTLANGLRVIIAPDHGLPLVGGGIQILSGSTSDPAQADGSARMTAALVTQGAGKRSATRIAQDMEALGADLSAQAGWDSSAVHLNVRSDRLKDALPIFADVVRVPTFAAEEVARQRQQALDELTVTLRNPGALASIAANRTIYGDAPYGRMAGGTPASLAKLNAEQLQAYHRTWWRPDNAVLVLAGDITPEQGFALAEQQFGDWAKPKQPLPARVQADTAVGGGKPRVLVVNRPDSGQAAVTAAQRGISRIDGQYFPAIVANSILGGGYSSRLNQEIRIKRGLSYGASSSVGARVGAGPIVASTQTKNVSAPEVAGLIEGELKRLGDQPPGDAELTARKAVLIGGFGRDIETNEGLAGELADLATVGMPLIALKSYVDNVQAVTAAQVQEAGRTLFSPDTANLVVAGDSREFLDALKKAHPDVEVIQAEGMNLDSPTLK